MRMTFEEFIEGNFPEDDYSLYIVWRGAECLYIGISKDNIWNRWFSRNGCHIRMTDNHMIGNSIIGREIVKNLPQSLQWTIELREYKNLHRAEIDLIRELRPTYNRTYNYER